MGGDKTRKLLKLLASIIVLINILFTVSLYGSPAVTPIQDKILLICLYRNKSTLSPMDETQPKKYGIVVKPLKEKLTNANYMIIEDKAYYHRMKSAGFPDIQSMEKSDILDLFKNDGLDYILMLEFSPFENRDSSASIGYRSDAHVKLLNVHESKYLYNGKIYKHTTWGSGFAPIRKIAAEICTIIDEKLININKTND